VTFRVLFVCTANICRSPMAQRLFEARLPADTDIEASSAGTRALRGYPMDAPSATVLQELGGDPSGHVAAQLTRELVEHADLMLCATSVHRAEILRESPAAMRRTFTLREFARLAAHVPEDPDATLAARVAEAGAQRGIAAPAESGDEIGDPFGAPLDVVRMCGAQISGAVDGVVGYLRADRDGSSSARERGSRA
jgi:protein-tyrosine phosphatase